MVSLIYFTPGIASWLRSLWIEDLWDLFCGPFCNFARVGGLQLNMRALVTIMFAVALLAIALAAWKLCHVTSPTAAPALTRNWHEKQR